MRLFFTGASAILATSLPRSPLGSFQTSQTWIFTLRETHLSTSLLTLCEWHPWVLPLVCSVVCPFPGPCGRDPRSIFFIYVCNLSTKYCYSVCVISLLLFLSNLCTWSQLHVCLAWKRDPYSVAPPFFSLIQIEGLQDGGRHRLHRL